MRALLFLLPVYDIDILVPLSFVFRRIVFFTAKSRPPVRIKNESDSAFLHWNSVVAPFSFHLNLCINLVRVVKKLYTHLFHLFTPPPTSYTGTYFSHFSEPPLPPPNTHTFCDIIFHAILM